MSYPESKWGPLKQNTGSHLEKTGRPVVLENVSGGHVIFLLIEREKKKRLLLPFFHRGRTLNMFFFTSPYAKFQGCFIVFE